MEHEYNTVEEALEDLKQGKIVLVTDDENRENEGDMICAAEFATQEILILWRVMQRDSSVLR